MVIKNFTLVKLSVTIIKMNFKVVILEAFIIIMSFEKE